MATTTRTPKGKVVSHTYVKKTNKNFLERLSKKSGQSMSSCLDAVLDSVRLKKELKIEKKIPKYVVKAEAYKKARK